MRYLLISHIAYAQAADGSAVVSSLLAEGLKGLDLTFGMRVRRVLKRAVDKADLVHTCNLFDPYTALF